MRIRAIGVFAVVVASGPGLAHAQKDVEIPAGFEHFEVSDVSFTLRDDTFNVITTDPGDPRTAYVGTHQGRFYKTADGGQTWTETTIIPEQRLLWATPGSSLFFGAIRDAGGNASAADLIGSRAAPLNFSHIPSQLGRLPSSAPPQNPLANETAISAGSGVSFLGVGLSERSPRLSILTASRGHPVPKLSRQTLLAGVSRGTVIFWIAVDPDDRRLLFAATSNGLYKSYDAGDSWSRSFAGSTAAERTALRVSIRPGDPKLMILGTTSGAFSSVNRGDSWSKIATVGDAAINEVAFDAKEPNFIYLATGGGVLRSNDGGQNFLPIYYSTFPAEADVRSVVIDPFDADTGYIGTMRGAFVTHKLRTAQLTDWTALEGVQSILAVPRIAACSHHRDHLYALTQLQMTAINYGADAPESAILESWDGGHTWRQLFVGESDGTAQTFALDAKDPDQLWIGWTTALHRLERTNAKAAPRAEREEEEETSGPTMSQLVLAALRYQGLELDDYTKKIHRKQLALLPRVVTVTGSMQQWSAGGVLDDAQFANARYLQVGDARDWSVMAWATWSLPDLVYHRDAVPMLRLRVAQLDDEIRHRVTETVRRNYGELQRIRAELAVASLDVKTQVIYRLRIEELEAVVDLTSGGYLTRWQKAHRRTSK